MSCSGAHLGFPIDIKNRNLVKDFPMIIHLQFGFSQFINFREEDLWNFSQSEHITGSGISMLNIGLERKTETLWRTIQGTFLLSLVPIGKVVLEKKLEMWKVYRRDDRREVITIVLMDLWSSLTKKRFSGFT